MEDELVSSFWDASCAGKLDEVKRIWESILGASKTRLALARSDFSGVTERGHLRVLKWFDEIGWWPKMKDFVMCSALLCGYIDIVKWCLTHGYQVADIDFGTLRELFQSDYTDCMNAILHAGLGFPVHLFDYLSPSKLYLVVRESRYPIDHMIYRQIQVDTAIPLLTFALPLDVVKRINAFL